MAENLDYSFLDKTEVKNFGKYQGRQKEAKKSKPFLNILGIKRRKPFEKSLKQKVLDAVTRTNDYTDDNVVAQAKKIGYTMTYAERLYIQAMAETKIALKSAKIPVNLFKKKLCYYHMMITLEKIDLLTNDNLVWELNWANELNKNPINKKGWKILFDGDSDCTIKEVTVVSGDLPEVDKIKRGYMQDKSEKVCAIKFKDNLTDKEYEKFLSENIIMEERPGNDVIKTGNFSFAHKGYNYRMFKSNLLIYESNIPLKDAAEIYKKQVFVSDNINKGSELKTIDKKNNILYISYINKDISIFCPSLVTFSKTVPVVKSMIRLEIDYNDLYRYVEKSMKKKVIELDLPPNILFWDTIKEYFDFLLMIKVTSENLERDLKTDITAIYDVYDSIKPVLNLWKDLYVLFKNIVLNFYDGVTTRITIDGVTKLKPNIDKFLSNYNILKTDNTFTLVSALITKIFPHCEMMLKFISTDLPKEIVQYINVAVSSVMLTNNTYRSQDLMEYFTVAGAACFAIFFQNEKSHLIPELRSGNSFLGDVARGISKETIKQKIENIRSRYLEKVVISQNNVNDQIDKYMRAREYLNMIARNTFENHNNGTLREILANDYYKLFIYNLTPLYDELMKDVLIWMDEDEFDQQDAQALDFEGNPYMKVVLTKLDSLNQSFQNRVNENKISPDRFNTEVAAPTAAGVNLNNMPREQEKKRRDRLKDDFEKVTKQNA